MRGPVPKRSDQRRRTNSPTPRKAEAGQRPTMPRASKDWHPLARRWYRSLAHSGQSRFYEHSDWAAAYIVAENLTRLLKPRYVATVVHEDGTHTPLIMTVPISGNDLSAIQRLMTGLCVTEGDRRRAGIELISPEADTDEDAAEDELDAFKRRKQA